MLKVFAEKMVMNMFGVGSLVVLAACSISAEPMKVIAEAGEHARLDTPVSISLDWLEDPVASARVVEIKDGERTPVPSQLDSGDPPRLWWILHGESPAGGKRIYEIQEGPGEDAQNMEVVQTDEALEIKRGDAKVLRYNTAITPLPPDADPKYKRSGYINPAWSPSGQVVTDRAKDYLHQLGIWLAFTQTTFEGRTPNFWDLLNGKAAIQFGGMEEMTSGPVFGGFRVIQDHIDLAAPEGEKVALKEFWDVRAWNVGGPEAGYWVWDITTTLRCATASPVLVREAAWGAMAIRGAPEWYGDKCRFLTSEGKTRTEANHTRVRWCDMSGSTDDAWSGLTVMSHPKNLRHPEPIRANETIPYFSFVGAFLGDWEIAPQEDRVFRYRFYIHDGEVAAEDAERVWLDFADPPKVHIGQHEY